MVWRVLKARRLTQQTNQSLVRLMKSSTFGQGLSRSESDQEMLDKLFFSYQPKAGCIYPGILCKYFVVLCRSLQGVAYHQQLINGCCSTFRENFCVCFKLWCNLFNYLLRNRKQLHWFLISFIHKANWTGYFGKGVGFIHSIGRYQGLCSQCTG